MLMSIRLPPTLTPSSEQGFSLIELLVAMLASIVVVIALYTIINFTLNQEVRTNEIVQADQVGRTVMSSIVEELHSSCTGVAPIQQPSSTPTLPLLKSGPLSMWFISAYGDAGSGNASLSEVTEHDIVWTLNETSNTSKELGTLTDYAFKSEDQSPPWTFPSLTTSIAAKSPNKVTILAKDVIPNKINSESTIFQYYKYEKGVFVTSKPSTSAAEAEDVAKVTIGFSQASTGGGLGSTNGGDTRTGRPASFSDSVVLRLDPTEKESEGPCE
jgi:type II secretory pathway pseudopilin PulG